MLKQFKEPFQHKPLDVDLTGPVQKRNKAPKAKDLRGTLKRIWDYLARRKGLLSFVFIMVIISSALNLLGPFLIGKAIDRFLVTKEVKGLFLYLIVLLVVYIFNSVATWLQNIWMIDIAQDTVYSMRTELFRQLHKLPISFFDKRQHGEIMSRVTNDIENVSQTLNSSFIEIISSILTLIGTIAVMLYLNPLLMVITLFIVPAMFLGIRWITRRTGKFYKEQQRNLGDMNGYIEEIISGQRIIKSFSQEQRVINEFREKNERLKQTGFWARTYAGFIPKVMNVLNSLSYAVIALFGGLLALHGDGVTIGMIVIFAQYARQFTRPLNDLANQFNTLLSAVAGAERVFEILDEDIEERDETNAIELDNMKGKVDFEQVSFSYEEDGNTLTDVNLHVQPGEMVALVGPTGAGKSTIINLLSRFYDTNEGHIYIDGQDIKQVKRSNLRSFMGFVLQDSYLFRGTVKDNIRYGRLDASDDEVVEAAKLANAHSFIMKLPDQYETVLEQDGGGISQGQKQLLSIARAILANPSLLILDEATSSIDTVTEVKIQEALQRLMEGRTSFVVAHRLNTIQRADQILVINDGRLIESGTHQSLLKEQGFYYGLYHNQLTTGATS